MSVITAIENYLLNTPSIQSKINTRLYPLILPANNKNYPAMTSQTITAFAHHDIDVAFPRVQLSCWGKRIGDVRDLSKTVFNTLSRFKGVLEGYQIEQIVHLSDGTEIYDREAELFHIPMDFKIIYRLKGE